MEATTPLLAHDVPVKKIYAAMVAVMAELARVGIAKDRKNEQQGFRFRGIDDVMNVVPHILAKHNICFLPGAAPLPSIDRTTGDGKKTLIYAKVQGTYRFVSSLDESEVSVTMPGEAMDMGDKAGNKALSAALKYVLLHTFLIPTEASDDADATTPEPSRPKPPAGFDAWFVELTVMAPPLGAPEVTRVWGSSTEECRQYATAHFKDQLAEARASAKEATAKAKAAAKAAEAPIA